MADFLNTPQTEAGERTRVMLDFSEIASFIAPAGGDDLVNEVRKGRNNSKYAPLRTPSHRQPLIGRPNPPARQEFTPLLKSAMKNTASNYAYANSTTPAPSKPAFVYSSPALPERSMLGESQMTTIDNSTIPMIPDSSSTIGTPLPSIPARGELGTVNGNLLTLKEQEAKLEQIDKENFGLKLKIHFLEEHLKKSGTEYNQETIKQNTELRAKELVLEREIKKYLRQLKISETELEQYRIQLEQFKEKVRSRHMNEAMRDELESYKQLAERREQELEALRAEIEELRQSTGAGDNEDLDQAQGQIEELESDLRDRDRALEEKEDLIEDLEAKVRELENADDDSEKDEKIESQQEEIEQLQQEIQRIQEEHEDMIESQDAMEELRREHAAQVQQLQQDLENSKRETRDMQQTLESKYTTASRERQSEIDSLQRRLQSIEDEKLSEIESLRAQLQIAESRGDDQTQVAQQAAADAQQKLRIIILKKDSEIEELQSKVDSFAGIQDELDLVRRQWRDANEDVEKLQKDSIKQNEAAAELRAELSDRTQDLRVLQSPSKNRLAVQALENQITQLQSVMTERTDKIIELQKTVESQSLQLDEFSGLKIQKETLDHRVSQFSREVNAVKAEVADRDRQLESIRKTLNERSTELEVLRNASNRPHTQVEGLQSIIRSRDQDLANLRTKVVQQDKDIETFQRLSNERLKAIDDLKAQFDEEKQDLRDEIEVLECSLDEAEEKVANLVKELQSHESPTKVTHYQTQIKANERERIFLQQSLEALQHDQSIADKDRLALHNTITKLRSDLHAAQTSAQTTSPLPHGSSAELRSLRLEQRDLQLRHRDAEAKAQAAREEAGRVGAQVVGLQRRHGAEIKGLVKQLQVLRNRLDREKSFRNDLAFQKSWFLMMVEMYDTCNATNIRMIEEMGITPSRTVRSHRPTIKIVAQSLIFCMKVKKASIVWAENKRIQEVLVKKMEAARSKGGKDKDGISYR